MSVNSQTIPADRRIRLVFNFLQIVAISSLEARIPMVSMRYGLQGQSGHLMCSASLMMMGHGPCYNIASMATQTSTEDGSNIVMASVL